MKQVIEAGYPISFRKREADALRDHLARHHSVVLIGMKRVGISNFLRFFLSHEQGQLFVPVDLNDLIERNLSAFWTLMLTRVVDAAEHSGLPEEEKKKCRRLFVQSIQLKDHFFTLESVRKVLEMLVSQGMTPVLFLLRFDRLTEAVTSEFFSNLVGLRDAVKGKMSYVFTGFRPFTQLSPVITKDMYLPPATDEDMKIILETLEGQYHASFEAKTRESLIQLSGGYVQYLQLAVIRLHAEKTVDDILTLLSHDEQITLQSEELFESLTKKEKEVLLSVHKDRHDAEYLWNTGIVRNDGKLFSQLFATYVSGLSLVNSTGSRDFTKKEHLMYTYLLAHVGELCEREAIIDAVWMENKELGVSDWAIDRLVARLRNKLKAQGSPYQIITVVTRGYKLVKTEV